MHSNFSTNLVYFCLTACTITANTYASPNPNPDPSDPTALTPPLTYRSPLADYRVFGEDKSVVWRDANDTVARIGGWREYAREAAAAMKAREANTAKPSDSNKGKQPPPPPAPIHKHGL